MLRGWCLLAFSRHLTAITHSCSSSLDQSASCCTFGPDKVCLPVRPSCRPGRLGSCLKALEEPSCVRKDDQPYRYVDCQLSAETCLVRLGLAAQYCIPHDSQLSTISSD